MQTTSERTILIVGGGFTGAALVIHLARQMIGRARIVVVEPSAELGRGVAYSTRDPAHRVNVPTDFMALSEDDADEATRWFADRSLLHDPNSSVNQGKIYVSRYDYGTFMASALRTAVEQAAGRIVLDHRRTIVASIASQGQRWVADLADGSKLAADTIALCYGHSAPRIPFEMSAGVLGSPKFVAYPWAGHALAAIGDRDSILVVGTGLTMVDVALSLRDRGCRGPIAAVSRHGLTPRPHGDFHDRDTFLDRLTPPATARQLLRSVRRRSQETSPSPGWRAVADGVSAALPTLWRSLPAAEKARAVRRLLPFWDVHRFRIPPSSHLMLEQELARGALTIVKAGVARVRLADGGFSATLTPKRGPAEERLYDAVVVCTGPDKNLRKTQLVASLLDSGIAKLDDVELGLDVDAHSRVVDPCGVAHADLFAFGPMTRSSFGEMSGANDIAAQIERVVRAFLAVAPRNSVGT